MGIGDEADQAYARIVLQEAEQRKVQSMKLCSQVSYLKHRARDDVKKDEE